jgi:hypothetical protein
VRDEDHDRDRHRDEQEHDEPEARAGPPRGAAMLDACMAAGAMVPVGTVDRIGVERRRVDLGLPDFRLYRICLDHVRIVRRNLARGNEILARMASREDRFPSARGASLLALSDNLALVAGLVLSVSAFTGWYTGPSGGITVSITGWHTGTLGKLVFFAGLAVLLVVVLREIGVELPAAAPESLVTIALGAISTIFVLVRIVSIPDDFFFAGRGVGIWISLLAAIGVIAAGLLQVSEEI